MKKGISITIDTRSNEVITVGVIADSVREKKQEALGTYTSQVVLPFIHELLATHNLELENVTNVQVETGPGSFTGLRVGIAIANALGYLLAVPINGEQKGTIVEPTY